MIITRSPLRVSFAGGGTDIPAFYEKYGPGAVVSTSINKHVYVTLSRKFDGKVSIRYRIHEAADNVRQIKHHLIREALLSYGVESGVEIVVMSDVPARGSGLGASSALACALVAALESFTKNSDYSHPPFSEHAKCQIAKFASDIEIKKVGSPIGKQDHYASAFGGVNLILFEKDGSVSVRPFTSSDFIDEIQSQSMLFYLNMEHEYSGGSFVQRILRDQVSEMDSRRKTYELQRDNALSMWDHMSYEVPERFIDHVNENWRIKRGTHRDVSNVAIDKIVQKAFAAGATAAKVCGAGGGGFLYLIVPPSMQEEVRGAMGGFPELKFSFDSKGTEVLFDDSKECEESVVVR